MNRIAIFTLFILLMIIPAACGGGDEPAVAGNNPPTLDPQQITSGAELYALHCSECHGADLEGETDWKVQNPDGSFRAPPHDESGHTWHHSDAQLIDAVRYGGARLPADVGGTSAMPAYGDILTDDEIAAVLDYIRSTWPDDIRRYQWERTSQ